MTDAIPPGVPCDSHTLEVNYHALVADSPDPVLLFDLERERVVDANLKAQELYGMSEPQLLACGLSDLCPPLQPGGQPSGELLAEQVGQVLGGEIRVFETAFQHAGGRRIDCELRLVLLPVAGRRLLHVRIVDITRRTLARQLRIGQAHLLEMVARGAPLGDTLDSLMLLIESQSEGVYCSVLLLDDDGVTVRSASGPSLPPAFMQALDGFTIGPAAGSCGTAMYRKDTVIVEDIMNDPLWAPYKGLAEPYGLRACWATPIFLEREQVLGSFAMYYREVRGPRAEDIDLIAVASHLAGIAIERTRRERELARHREHLEELVTARTAELAGALENLSLAQQELVQRDKLAALGALVAGVAHELNTPIGNSLVVATAMAERAQALAAGLGEGLRRSTLDAYLAQANEAGELLVRNLQRAAGLVASFRQIAVDHAGSQRRRFSLAELIEELAPSLRIAAKQRPITVEQALEADLSMDSYPGALTQALSNLFDNCLLHGFEGAAGGTIRIGAATRSPGVIALSVEDNGAGIPAALLGRVYDPFFTTRLGSGGSGLGLHVTHNIVTGILGGRIELKSELGKGTSFTLVLPAVAPQIVAAN